MERCGNVDGKINGNGFRSGISKHNTGSMKGREALIVPNYAMICPEYIKMLKSFPIHLHDNK